MDYIFEFQCADERKVIIEHDCIDKIVGMVGGPSTVPIPQDPAEDASDDCRLWIGNMDQRITEYSLLKILQKYGDLKRFDFLLSKSGPDVGKPRGYCFVSYQNRKDAEKAMKGLNGKLALSKKLIVKWAHAEHPETERPAVVNLRTTASDSDSMSPESKIRAIEEKLKAMEKTELEVTSYPVAPPGTSKLSAVNIQAQQDLKKSQNRTYNSYKPQHNRRPYNNKPCYKR